MLYQLLEIDYFQNLIFWSKLNISSIYIYIIYFDFVTEFVITQKKKKKKIEKSNANRDTKRFKFEFCIHILKVSISKLDNVPKDKRQINNRSLLRLDLHTKGEKKRGFDDIIIELQSMRFEYQNSINSMLLNGIAQNVHKPFLYVVMHFQNEMAPSLELIDLSHIRISWNSGCIYQKVVEHNKA